MEDRNGILPKRIRGVVGLVLPIGSGLVETIKRDNVQAGRV